MKYDPKRLFMIFDVESVGLHGEGFAFGYVVVDLNGVHKEKGWYGCFHELAKGSQEGRQWILENIPSEVLVPITGSDEECQSPKDVRDKFWQIWTHWKAQGATLWADCCWPVETNFLSACIRDDPKKRTWEGPYPLFDIASIIAGNDSDPLETNEREEGESPAHHPLADSIQSARIFFTHW